VRIAQVVLKQSNAEASALEALVAIAPQLVLVFGSVGALRDRAGLLSQAFPEAHIAGCSTAGEISNAGVSDHSMVVTALAFAQSHVHQMSTTLASMDDSLDAGRRLALGLEQSGLKAVMLFGQGVQINGSALLEGMAEVLGPQVLITGGLAGDGGAFDQTLVLDDQGVSESRLVCLGFYGEQLHFSHGSYGGWSPFGPARKVTRSQHNVLFELDGESALAVYKRYLGVHAKDLPVSGLLFPFAMLGQDHNELGLIRTILGVNEDEGSLTLAGDIDPEGYLKLMHASTDGLVGGAEVAAQAAVPLHAGGETGLAMLVSCVGRKLVMGGRVEEEVEAVADVLGAGTAIAGFYSYGEISPFSKEVECKLHNQTMTITYMTEAA